MLPAAEVENFVRRNFLLLFENRQRYSAAVSPLVYSITIHRLIKAQTAVYDDAVVKAMLILALSLNGHILQYASSLPGDALRPPPSASVTRCRDLFARQSVSTVHPLPSVRFHLFPSLSVSFLPASRISVGADCSSVIFYPRDANKTNFDAAIIRVITALEILKRLCGR